jgi:hypothetical protein
MTQNDPTNKESQENLPDDVDLFSSKLKDLGGKSGNKALREALGWENDENRYWNAHGRALDQGSIIPGRGKGGSVQIILEKVEPQSQSSVDQGGTIPSEISLYASARDVIENAWVKSENYDDVIIQVTGLRGSARTGGKWTRPDISILGTKAFPYLPDRVFDIVTFEIKPKGQTTVEGIFEALSHQQFASRSYCIFHVDQEENKSFQENNDDTGRILWTARKHGIGVIIATDIGDWETWDEIVSADRVSPDPEQANRFIAKCFSPDSLNKIIKWHK